MLDPQSPSVTLRVDARSYIMPSFQHRVPDVTVAFLGGSTTECAAVREDLRYPALISTLFAEQGIKVNTLNAGRGGNTLHDSLNILLNHVVDDHPDIIVLMHASNDVGVLMQDGAYRSRMGRPVSVADLGKWSLQMASSRLYLAGLMRLSATASVFRPQDSTADWRHDRALVAKLANLEGEYRNRLRSFVHIARDFGIEPVLMTEPFSGSANSLTPSWVDATALDRFNTIVREVGKDERILVIDLAAYLPQVPGWNKPMEVFYDAIHVTDRGSQVYARHIAARLLPEIMARTGKSEPMRDGADVAIAPPP